MRLQLLIVVVVLLTLLPSGRRSIYNRNIRSPTYTRAFSTKKLIKRQIAKQQSKLPTTTMHKRSQQGNKNGREEQMRESVGDRTTK